MLRKYEMVWRQNYEALAAAAWVLSIILMSIIWAVQSMPTSAFLALSAMAGYFLVINGSRAWRLWSITSNLSGKGISFLTDMELFGKLKRGKGALWVGRGFDWQPIHSQRLYELKQANPEVMYPPAAYMWAKQLLTGEQVAALSSDYVGAPWIHGVEPNERDMYVPLQNFIGNTLILGTTRCGKTRMIEIIVEQAIMMGHTVIMLDPKGDQALEASIKAACKAAGRENDFMRIHLAFPRSSIRIDLLKNYTNPSDLATRISSLMPGGDKSSSFRDFAWGVLNAIILGMLFVGEKPTLVRIRGYVENGIVGLLLRSLLNFMDSHLASGWEEDVLRYAKTLKQPRGRQGEESEINVRASVGLLVAYYSEVLRQRGHRQECIEALSTIYHHDSAHYGKMIANLLPILAMLTTGELGPLLSPDADDITDTRAITDNQSLIRSRSVLYFGLDSLANQAISSAVGSMYLSDMTSVAAAIYNYEPERGEKEKIFLVVDESSEVVNDPYITMLNKSAGAGVVNIAAAQTVPDFASRFESMEKARQMLGNFNNMVAMRLKDKVTQEYAVETFGETVIQTKQRTHTSATGTKTNITHFTGSIQEKVSEKLEAVMPPDTFGKMPNWQYVGSFSGGRIIKGRLPIIKRVGGAK